MSKKLLAICTTGIMGLLHAGPAHAQADGATGAVAETGQDIIVTAQRRAERLRDVPLSVSALNGEALAQSGIATGLGLTQAITGLNFQANGSTVQPAIRGVTSTGSNPGDASNVAIYVDGVYQPFQAGNYIDLVNIERVEVLKGPQGTLFGRNAAGGAISVTTRSPQFDPEGHVTVGYGRFGDVRGEAYATSAISDSIAADFSFKYVNDDGFRKDIVTGRDLATREYLALRSKVLLKASDTVRITIAGDYADSSDNSVFSGQPLNGNAAAAPLPGAVIATRPNSAALSFVPTLDVKGGGASLRAELELPFADLTSLTAYRRYTSFQHPDSDITPVRLSETNLSYDIDTWSQELNLASNGKGPFKWIAGLFLFDDRAAQELASFAGVAPTYTTLVQVLLNRSKIHTRSAAVYGEANYAVTDRLTVIGGLRYSHDKISYVGTNGVITVNPEASFDSVTPRASIRYEVLDRTNIYATYSKGFKAGVFNPGALATTPVNPEKIDAYEIGVKGGVGRLFSFSAAGFHYDYRDLQFQAFGATSIVPILQNAANAKIDGAEVEATLNPVAGLSVRGGLAYTDARYSDFAGAQGFIPRPGGGNNSALIDASGNRMIRTPKWSGNAAVTYDMPAFDGTLSISGNAFFSGRVYYDVANRAQQKPYQIYNASLSWTTPDDHWRVTIFGENLSDEVYVQSLLVSGLGYNVNFGRPATYGARLTYQFGR